MGLKGIVIKCHGRADWETVANGIRVPEQALETSVLERISECLAPEGAKV